MTALGAWVTYWKRLEEWHLGENILEVVLTGLCHWQDEDETSWEKGEVQMLYDILLSGDRPLDMIKTMEGRKEGNILYLRFLCKNTVRKLELYCYYLEKSLGLEM